MPGEQDQEELLGVVGHYMAPPRDHLPNKSPAGAGLSRGKSAGSWVSRLADKQRILQKGQDVTAFARLFDGLYSPRMRLSHCTTRVLTPKMFPNLGYSTEQWCI